MADRTREIILATYVRLLIELLLGSTSITSRFRSPVKERIPNMVSW